MNETAQIRTQLKTLKLSGILDTLDLRVMEARQNSLSYSEFLTSVLLDEMEKRDMNKLGRLISKARIGSGKTLETFDFSFNASIQAAHIRELATCRFIEKGENIFLLGPTGTGKTHLSMAISHLACRKHFSVRFFKAYEFFKELAKADLNGKIDKMIKELINVDLLVIDDFAFKKVSQKDSEFLYAIVDQRYQTKSIIVTSNRAMSDWGAIFPDPVMANAIMDRLAHNAHQIIIKGESYRKKMSPKLKSLDIKK